MDGFVGEADGLEIATLEVLQPEPCTFSGVLDLRHNEGLVVVLGTHHKRR